LEENIFRQSHKKFMNLQKLESLGKTQITPITNGNVSGIPIEASQLWSDSNVLFFIVRRPGCPLCREHAKDITERFESGEYFGSKLVGIIKEIAPISGAETDELLGVGEFQSKYFANSPVYLDSEQKFFKFLGEKTIYSQSLPTWNPFKLYANYKLLKQRLDSKGIEGNMKGDYYLRGGVLLISQSKGVTYQCEELVGSEFPYAEIGAALKIL
jgi:hypothetical protein